MPRIFLLAALRNLLRRKVQSLINITSLAIGLTVFGFAFLYVKQELSYDRGWPDGERVHRLLVDQRGIPGAVDQVHTSALDRTWQLITGYFAADIEAATRTSTGPARLVDSESRNYMNLKFVDPQFLDLFQLEAVDGDLRRALSGPGFIAVDETTAERLGLAGRVGERFAFTSFYEGEVEYELAAIFRLPQPVSFATSTQMFTLIHDYSRPLFTRGELSFVPWETSTQVWLKLRPGVTTAGFNAQQPAFIQQEITAYNDALGPERNISDHLFYRWQPLPEIRFNPTTTESGGNASGDPARVITFAAVGLLVLLVGCSNSISLSLAVALERRREIGVRKAAGALPQDILRQQLGESVLLALLALIPSIAMLEWLLPAFQALMPTVRVDAAWNDHLLLALIAGIVGLACGAYPALVLSATRPQAVLRTGAQQGAKGGLSLRTVLVAAQFCFASMLLIGTAALYLQLALTRAQPLGFDASNTVMLFSNGQQFPMDALRTELEKIAGVVGVIPVLNRPNANLPAAANMRTLARDLSGSAQVEVTVTASHYDFVELMGIRVLAGRDFDARFDAFDRETLQLADGAGLEVQRIMINATAARQLGFATPEDAVERTVYRRSLNNRTGEVNNTPMRILGVFEDNQYESLRRRPGPEIYMPLPSSSNLLLKFEDAIEPSIREKIQNVAQRMHGIPFPGMVFLEPQLELAFRQEQNESKLLLICAGLALMLASFGLYGLAAFAIERQVKEVGVRKVMGAAVSTIVGLYLWRFARPILLASIVAWPAAIYFVLQWIERFPYQLERAWLAPLCVATLGAVLLIAMLTVSVITTRAAMANPVRSLRYE